MTRASCLCGEVMWALDGPLELMSHCHCSCCRKGHGAAFATYVVAPAARFRQVFGDVVPGRLRADEDVGVREQQGLLSRNTRGRALR